MKKSNFLKELKTPVTKDAKEKRFSYSKPVTKPTANPNGTSYRLREFKTVKDTSTNLVTALKEKK